MTALDLESFDVTEMKWIRSGSPTLEIEETRFLHGAFRDAFRATTVDKNVAQTKWVVKQYQEKASTAIKDDLGMSLEDHTRKQVQMNVKTVVIICKNSLVQYFLVIKIGNFKVKCLS